MLEEIKLMLGESANNYTDAQIALAYKTAKIEIEEYCNRKLDTTLELIAERVAVIKLNRLGTEGLSGEGFSGVTQNYLDGYPQEIISVLNRKRLIKVI